MKYRKWLWKHIRNTGGEGYVWVELWNDWDRSREIFEEAGLVSQNNESSYVCGKLKESTEEERMCFVMFFSFFFICANINDDRISHSIIQRRTLWSYQNLEKIMNRQ